jgi:hypothetical protein
MRYATLLVGLWLSMTAGWGQETVRLADPPPATLSEAPARPEYPDGALDEPRASELAPTQATPSCPQCRHRREQQALTRGGRFYSALLDALYPCDTCYQPAWHPLESASFFVESARPQNRTRFRWDYGQDMIFPDRAEYFWARIDGLGPDSPAGSSLDYHELSVFTEIAHGQFSAFTVMPYRSLYLGEAGHAAGFADMQIGTKSLVYDSPLLQIALQMTTTVPSANPKKGLGTGHVALEPALLAGLSLTARDSLQLRVGEWIPIGGDPDYQGALLRWGAGWNRVAWQRDPNNLMTVNLDLAGWSFQDGSYTDPQLPTRQSANNESYVYLGPGMRLLICGKLELGTSGVFALTRNHFAEHLIRTEMTIRY